MENNINRFTLTKNKNHVANMTEEAVRDELIYLRDKLDELDEDDYFGTEGWKHFILGE